MSVYIVCPRKRSAPRVNILVCRRKCDFKDDCQVYREESQSAPSETEPVMIADHESAAAASAP
ncbi:MAG: hypothetical protein JRF59_08395 [Deltaproteobacteria bacterium]|nr:hypothetical protein [Deltaproteobacteria bacterium]MBW1923066.1 hypothetical protein [Deltaproteobacteria bacterium]MBW1949099.1 hypothetical protein [Deltaproteobacteria bacterium]MBW2008592.1 hypothetical protein [Deltaproteobacteria bacterium]MBW2347847.1 hypothetical protein [Deltaproteobacteria bacterium]